MSPAPVTAWPGFDRERSSVRVVLLDGDGRILLFDTHDPTSPGTGRWWEMPGGGVEPGEDVPATAVREIAEETGIVLARGAVGRPHWRRDVTYARRGIRTLQHEVVVVARVADRCPAVDRAGRTSDELEEYLGHRWWTVDEVVSSTARFFPGGLPGLLVGFLAGEDIDEPFEFWN